MRSSPNLNLTETTRMDFYTWHCGLDRCNSEMFGSDNKSSSSPLAMPPQCFDKFPDRQIDRGKQGERNPKRRWSTSESISSSTATNHFFSSPYHPATFRGSLIALLNGFDMSHSQSAELVETYCSPTMGPLWTTIRRSMTSPTHTIIIQLVRVLSNAANS
jgi:hypothetical protein